jgi:NADH-quinone oxidoreductase subunit A
MLSSYLPVLLLAGLVGAFAVLSLGLSRMLRRDRPNPIKEAPYESGIEPEGDVRGQRFPVKFYVVAMLFIIFDIEIIFLFPWAISFRQLGLFGLVEMAVFIGLVFVAYVYVWRKGGLDWQEDPRGAADRRADVGPAAAPRKREVVRAG